MNRTRGLLTLASLALGICLTIIDSTNASTRFLVHLNQNQNSSDSARSVTYYDADDIASGPLFSVFLGFEEPGNGNFEEINAIDVDPLTADAYVLAIDTTDYQNDSGSDFDIYKIPFATVFNHWSSTFRGNDARSLGASGPTPSSGGYANSNNQDYVTFSTGDFDFTHSNQVALPGVIEKIGEVKRNNSASFDFFPFSLEFVDQDTLFIIDDASSAVDDAATDHEYRILNRVNTTAGFADDSSTDFGDGGYNKGTTESWNSQRLALVNLDPSGHSEPESSAFYDNGTGVRGIWVTESDLSQGGDDIAFFQLDGSGYRPLAGVGIPIAGDTSFELDEDPSVSSTSNDGEADNIFVDENGDLIIVESADYEVFEPNAGIEPSVYRIPVNTYQNGSGQIEFGNPGPKFTLNPTKTPGDGLLERGHWSAFDPVTNTVYMANPGVTSPENPELGFDIFSINVDTGVTQSFLDLDDSVNMRFGDRFGDTVDFFVLIPEPTTAATSLVAIGLSLLLRSRKP